MSLQYLSDDKGQIMAVQVPISEWENMKNKYPGIDKLESTGIPDWQKDLIDLRLSAIASNPDLLLPIESLFKELDSESEL